MYFMINSSILDYFAFSTFLYLLIDNSRKCKSENNNLDGLLEFPWRSG